MTFEHDSIEKYVILMGKLINNISVNIENTELGSNETLRVPVTYGPREKVLAAANRPSVDDNIPAKVALTLPRIAFEIAGGPQYDSVRQSTATQKIKLGDHDYIYNPPAWNIPFTVSVVAKSARVANRIMEQIVSRFVPALTITVKPLDGYPEYKKDVIIELEGAVPNNTYQGDFMERQFVGWDLQFLVKGWLFGPVTEGQRITKVEVNFIDNTTTEDFLEGVDITPDLTSSGEPTSNASLTIPRNSIEHTDNYGYIVDYNSDGD